MYRKNKTRVPTDTICINMNLEKYLNENGGRLFLSHDGLMTKELFDIIIERLISKGYTVPSKKNLWEDFNKIDCHLIIHSGGYLTFSNVKDGESVPLDLFVNLIGINYYYCGLNVGDAIKQDVLNAWAGNGENYLDITGNWKVNKNCSFLGDRTITSFFYIKNKLCFHVSESNHDLYIKAEGFKDFSDNFYSKQQMKNLSHDDLIENKIYYIETMYPYIIRYKKCDNGKIKGYNGKIKGYSYISIYSRIYGYDYMNALECHNLIREATEEEKNWLIACENKGKYVPKTTPMKIDQQTPEYYEYVNNYENNFTKGRIYKIINPLDINATNNFIDNTGSANGFAHNNHKYFKPSTKDAFDKQENTKKEKITYISKPFGFNKWYKFGNNGLVYVISEREGYGFKNLSNNVWYTLGNQSTSYFDLSNLKLATEEDVKKRFITYVKEKYPVGTIFRNIITGSLSTICDFDFRYYPEEDQLTNDGTVYLNGEWADIVQSTIDRSGYFLVKSQDEYIETLDYLQRIGEQIDSLSKELCVAGDWAFVVCNYNRVWSLTNIKPEEKEMLFIDKQISNTPPTNVCVLDMSNQIDYSCITTHKFHLSSTIKEDDYKNSNNDEIYNFKIKLIDVPNY